MDCRTKYVTGLIVAAGSRNRTRCSPNPFWKGIYTLLVPPRFHPRPPFSPPGDSFVLTNPIVLQSFIIAPSRYACSQFTSFSLALRKPPRRTDFNLPNSSHQEPLRKFALGVLQLQHRTLI